MVDRKQDVSQKTKGVVEMRKLVSLGLLALIFSMISSHSFASNVEACNPLKKAQKGLHGLCVAWHNADDKQKLKIEAKFADRATYSLLDFLFPDSESDFVCPCWDTAVSAAFICSLGEPPMAFFASDYFNLLIFNDGEFDEMFSADVSGCGYDGSQADFTALKTPDELSPEEARDCIDEARIISTLYMDEEICG
jgi:hypothetical protein